MEIENIEALVTAGLATAAAKSDLVKKVYDDVLGPSMKKVGQALSTVVDLGNTILLPVKLMNDKARLNIENNLKKYQSKLEKIPEDKIFAVPSEIAVPILERFTYVNNEDLSNAFVNLLVTASSSDTIALAHPSFTSIIDRLSPDEAKMLEYFHTNRAIAKLKVGWRRPTLERTDYVFHAKTLIENFVHLNFPENAGIYFDNLCSLGLLVDMKEYVNFLQPQFDLIIKENKDLIESQKLTNDSPRDCENIYLDDRGMYANSEYGELFMKACLK